MGPYFGEKGLGDLKYVSKCVRLREQSFILVPPGPGRIWGATKFFRPVWGATKFFRPIWGATRFFKRVWGAAKFFRLVWGATKFFRPTWSLEGNFLDLIGGLRKFSDRFWGLRNFLDQFGGLRNFLDPLGGLRNFSDLFGGLRNELKIRPSPPGTSINDRSLMCHVGNVDVNIISQRIDYLLLKSWPFMYNVDFTLKITFID